MEVLVRFWLVLVMLPITGCETKGTYVSTINIKVESERNITGTKEAELTAASVIHCSVM